jgi:S1-C subfamily serine protease
MELRTEVPPTSRSRLWKERIRRIGTKLKSLIPFTAGIVAALLGLLVYNAFNPAPIPLTLKLVNTAVAQAMASATPAPAYSAQVYCIIQPSLVLIQVKGQDANGEEVNGLGSGVVISDKGEILTALHVVQNASQIQITFADGSQTSAQVESTQPENDIAVLLPEQLPAVLVPAVMGNPNAMRVGDEAFVVGNPFGLYS